MSAFVFLSFLFLIAVLVCGESFFLAGVPERATGYENRPTSLPIWIRTTSGRLVSHIVHAFIDKSINGHYATHTPLHLHHLHTHLCPKRIRLSSCTVRLSVNLLFGRRVQGGAGGGGQFSSVGPEHRASFIAPDSRNTHQPFYILHFRKPPVLCELGGMLQGFGSRRG